MWNMMCDVMPTISEDGVAQRAASQFATVAAAAAAAAASGNGEDEANFEQLMVSMLDERDKLGRKQFRHCPSKPNWKMYNAGNRKLNFSDCCWGDVLVKFERHLPNSIQNHSIFGVQF